MRSLVAVLLVGLVGCSTIGGGGIFGPSKPYYATVCAELNGAPLVPCQQVAVVNIAQGGESLVSLVVALAGPYLLNAAKIESCTFETFPAQSMDGTIVVTGVGHCTHNGVPIDPLVLVQLTPVPPA